MDTAVCQTPDALLAVRGIIKAFGTNMVLKAIDMDIRAGEVVALIGGNGAGKSTLMKIIMGIYQPDDGEIYIQGRLAKLNKPSAALAEGIYLVPQEPMLFPNMTVEQNVLMGFDEKQSELRKRLQGLLSYLGWKLALDRKAATLSIAEQQLVEILRGLMREARLLILDEPTSSLTFHEAEALFQIVADLKAKGIGIVYITHRLTEVFQIADQVLIMRDGVITLSGPVSNFTREMLVAGLLPQGNVAHRLAADSPESQRTLEEPALVLEALTGYGFSSVSLKVYPGEILGLAGVVGAGRTELATTILGRDMVKSGRVLLGGKDITGFRTGQVLKEGLNYVTEDRFVSGIFRISDVAANTTAANLGRMSRFFLNVKEERKITKRFIEAFHTKVTGQDQPIGSLSGGNQQKVVISRALSTSPKVLILDEPTRGIDAAARGDLYAIIEELKRQGLAILLISSDIEEIMELSDRAVTMYCGRINQEFSKGEISQDRLMAASFGVAEGSAEHA
ncbi:MAG: ATP-binding cassette domain-containing protein [Firmicutes bacterium]|nr:ATP-binding cassette domain-containing protein [Bacillota bacterium]